jgi:hypothetical protein
MMWNQFLHSYCTTVEGSKKNIFSYLVMDLLRKSQLLLIHLNVQKTF